MAITKQHRRHDPKQMFGNAERAAEFLRALGQQNRLMILCSLAEGEKSVSELEEFLSIRQATVSQQLARLRGDGLVASRRNGKMIYYRLNSENARAVVGVVYELFCGSTKSR
jgi:ArsR family transcriptional regulator, virulence genes transcriptional regulator